MHTSPHVSHASPASSFRGDEDDHVDISHSFGGRSSCVLIGSEKQPIDEVEQNDHAKRNTGY